MIFGHVFFCNPCIGAAARDLRNSYTYTPPFELPIHTTLWYFLYRQDPWFGRILILDDLSRKEYLLKELEFWQTLRIFRR
jgi:hypothetical protein